MSPAASVLELQGVRVERGGVEVLDVPSFRLDDDELVALIGPNGSGKSTLLLTLMTLLPRAAGRVLFRGEELASNRAAIAARRRMAMVLQEPLLFDTTVLENVASGLRLRGVRRREALERAMAYLERFALAPMAGRAARKLSGGEARRVSLARALAVEPDVLLLDEPFSSLDVPTRQAITDDLERAVRDARIATVLVTHDQTEALRLADRIDVMQAGRLVQSDAPAVVMNNPANAFIASCVGMETILEGVVRWCARGEVIVEVAGRELDAVADAAPGDPVYACIRPENVLIDTADPGASTSARNVFPAAITSVASVGPYLKVKLDCGFPLVAHVTGESFATLELEVGKRVFASVKATAIHVIRRTGAPGERVAPVSGAAREGVTVGDLSRDVSPVRR
jgi:tungstate transport system ATP-binding protein